MLVQLATEVALLLPLAEVLHRLLLAAVLVPKLVEVPVLWVVEVVLLLTLVVSLYLWEVGVVLESLPVEELVLSAMEVALLLTPALW